MGGEEMDLLLKLDLQYFAELTMDARNAISGSQGRAFVTIDGERLLFASLINIDVGYAKNKTEVPIMGRPSKGNKANGLNYTGSATAHYNSSVFRRMVYKYQETGEDTYFDIQITNEDKTSTVGSQTIILKDCNIDSGTLAILDADADYLEDNIEFTIEKFLLPKEFTNESGMM